MSQAKKNAVALLLLIASFGSMFWAFEKLKDRNYQIVKTSLNESTEKSFRDFSTELQMWAERPTQKNGRIDVTVLDSLYTECDSYRRVQDSDSAAYLYPAFEAQVGKIINICTQLAQQEQHGGITGPHLKKAQNTFTSELSTTLQAVEPERQAWISSQMQSLAK